MTSQIEGPLQGKAYVVSGGARGIGAAIVKELVGQGARVAAFDRLHIDDSEKVRGFALDISREAQVIAAMDEAVQWLGRLDGTVAAAGVVLEQPATQTSAEDFDRVLGINLRGPFLLAREGARRFTPGEGDAGKPRIVTIGSELAHIGIENYSAYCASKGGVISMTRALARELAPHVTVNVVAPGPTDTDMLKSEEQYQRLKETAEGIPLGRLGEAEDIAHAVAFLLGPGASFITGAVIDVNGGTAMA